MDQPQDSPSAGRHANRRAPLAVSGLRSAPGASPAAHPRVQELGPPLGSPAGCSRPGHTPRRRGRVLDTWRHGSCGDAAGGADAGQAGRRAARGALQLRPRPAGRRAAEPAGPPPLSPADAGERPDESGATWAFGGWLGRPRGAGGHPARSSRMAFLLLPDRELLRVRVQVPEPDGTSGLWTAKPEHVEALGDALDREVPIWGARRLRAGLPCLRCPAPGYSASARLSTSCLQPPVVRQPLRGSVTAGRAAQPAGTAMRAPHAQRLGRPTEWEYISSCPLPGHRAHRV